MSAHLQQYYSGPNNSLYTSGLASASSANRVFRRIASPLYADPPRSDLARVPAVAANSPPKRWKVISQWSPASRKKQKQVEDVEKRFTQKPRFFIDSLAAGAANYL
jgi:hypothetical protein